MAGDFYSTQRLTAETSVEEYLQNCVDVEKFLGYCRQCENYDRRWSCPSFDFEPLTVWRRFRTLRLESCVLTPLPGTTLEQLLEGLKREKDELHNELLAQERQFPGALALSAGSCKLCAECSRPLGEPCRRPEQMRSSIEALGGDVAKTGELYFHKPLLWIKNGEPPAYLTLVGGLLLP